MAELYFKMHRYRIKLEVRTITDDYGLDCVVFDFTSNRGAHASTVFYLDRILSNPDWVLEDLNMLVDGLIRRTEE